MYLRALFVGGWESAEKQEIEIPGVSPETMSALLNFAYTSQVNEAINLFKIAFRVKLKLITYKE